MTSSLAEGSAVNFVYLDNINVIQLSHYIKVFHGVLGAKLKIRWMKYNLGGKFGQSGNYHG